MQKKADVKASETNSLGLNTLMKLRLVVISIFILITMAVILFFANQWIIGATLGLIGYIAVFALMVKLLIIKEL